MTSLELLKKRFVLGLIKCMIIYRNGLGWGRLRIYRLREGLDIVWTVGKIYSPIFSFFRKRVVNIAFLNRAETTLKWKVWSGNFTFYWGIREFLNSFIFENITVFKNSRLLCHVLTFLKKWRFLGNSIYFTEFSEKWKQQHEIQKTIILQI